MKNLEADTTMRESIGKPSGTSKGDSKKLIMFCRWMLCLLLAGSVTSVSGQVLRFVPLGLILGWFRNLRFGVSRVFVLSIPGMCP
jgi:hypothetical protein